MDAFKFFILGFFILFINSNFLAQEPISLMEENHKYGETDLEKKWFEEIQNTHEGLDYNGYLSENDSLVDYINNIILKVKPKAVSEFKVEAFVLLSPEFNAGMYPNGLMQINTGALASLENEAQLAFIICHELAHFIYRHSLVSTYQIEGLEKGTKKIKSLEEYEKLRAEKSEFSRFLESEADSLGLKIYLNCGYPANEALKALEKLPNAEIELEIPKWVQKWFGLLPPLPTHPKKITRIEEIRQAIDTISIDGDANTIVYQEMTKGLVELNIELMKNNPNNLSLMKYLDNLLQTMSDTSSLYYKELSLSLGETYQMILGDPVMSAQYFYREKIINEKGRNPMFLDSKLAKKYFDDIKGDLSNEAIKVLNPLLEDNYLGHRVHRALGLIYYQEEDFEKAKYHLSTYVDSNKQISDKRYIRSLLRGIK